jgi:hypothetical protein
LARTFTSSVAKPTSRNRRVKSAIRRGRPDGKNASRAKGELCGTKTIVVIQAVVGGARQAVGTVVDIQQDGVVSVLLRPDQRADITDMNIDPWIVERALVEIRHRSARPIHDRRHQFRNDDLGIVGQYAEGGAQREPHAEAADQNAGVFPACNPLATKRGQRLFRTA